MRFGVVIFPGSNCEQDVIRATQFLGFESEYIWHGDTDLSGFDAIVLPGGFSYGDYIRTRCRRPLLARHGRGRALRREGRAGAGHLQRLPDPRRGASAARRAAAQRRSQVHLQAGEPARRGERRASGSTSPPVRILEIPINHNEGNYYCDAETSRRASTPTARSCCATSSLTASTAAGGSAPNGSLDDIAGICNERGNVFGLMPHPERVVDPDHRWHRRPAVLHHHRAHSRRGGRLDVERRPRDQGSGLVLRRARRLVLPVHLWRGSATGRLCRSRLAAAQARRAVGRAP